jgi:sulfofructose kinase
LTSPAKIDLLGLGIAPVDFFVTIPVYPACGTKVDGVTGSHLIAGGGPVANALCTFSRMGGNAALISAFGDDTWGDFARRELSRFGVDHSYCIERKKCPTALAFAWVAEGSRTIVLDLDRRLYIKPADFDLKRLPRPRLIHLDGRHMEAALKLARWGRKVGANIMLDVGSVRNDVDELFPYIDYLVCADDYARHFNRTRSISKAALGFKNLGIPEVVVTSGTAGSFGIDPDGRVVRQKAFRVDTVDVTGAGDVYHGAYLFGILKGWTLAQKMRYASAAAALKCQSRGARDGIPTFRQTMTFSRTCTEFYD